MTALRILVEHEEEVERKKDPRIISFYMRITECEPILSFDEDNQ